MKEFLKILGIIIGAIVVTYIVFVVLNIFTYRNSIKIVKQGSQNLYTDQQFEYSFEYPNNWVKQFQPLLAKGYVKISPANDASTSIEFWYKDSSKIMDIDGLLKFAQSDVDYAQTNQGYSTLSLNKVKLGSYDAVLWVNKDSSGNLVNTYYITTPTITSGQTIYVWLIIVRPGSQNHNSDITNILNSYSLLN